MTRKLHEKDICELSENTLEEELSQSARGDILVIASEDSRLTTYLPIHGQKTFGNKQLDFPNETEFCIEPIHNGNGQETHLPHTNNEQYHYETNQFDTTIQLFSLLGYFQRGPAFMDTTRITKPGGTILSINGLQPSQSTDHDAKWWIPKSNHTSLETIKILRHTDFQTPIVVSKFKVESTPEPVTEPTTTTR